MAADDKSSGGWHTRKMLMLLNCTVTLKRSHIPLFQTCSAVAQAHHAFTIVPVSFSFSTAKLTKRKSSHLACQQHMEASKLINRTTVQITWHGIDTFFSHQHMQKREILVVFYRLWSKLWHWIIRYRGSSWECQPVVTTNLIRNQHI